MKLLQKSFALLQYRQARCMCLCNNQRKCKVLILGGGAGGCSVAWRLSRVLGPQDIILLEPSETHYNQPSFPLVAAGLRNMKSVCRPTYKVLPQNITWLQDHAAVFEPQCNKVYTCKNNTIEYEYLVVAMGIVNNYEKIKGLHMSLADPNSGVSTVYSPEFCCKTWCDIKNMTGGLALFTFPNESVKCPGAAQKIMLLAEHRFRKNNVRHNIDMTYMSAREKLFGIEKYATTLQQVYCNRGIPVNFCWNLVEVGWKEALFARGEECIVLPFSLLHVTPPMCPPACLARSPLAGPAGYLAVDRHSLRHPHYCNVFGLGDCTDVPSGKSAGAIGPQSAVVAQNLLSLMCEREPTAAYDGYSVCPVATSYGKGIMAEYAYDKKLMETFPFDQSKESRILYHLNTRKLPKLYWNKLIQGKWDGPYRLRKLINPSKR